MSTIMNNIGGASISVKILPISKTTPPNPHVASDIQAFLSMMEKASFCGKDLQFSKCLESFLEEIDVYLDDGRMRDDFPELIDDSVVSEMEEFMNEHLPEKVKKNLKKLEED
jgi:hypothetical protein